ncbi:hypothetical protein BIU82_14655 [Arthrobacter sp. SW1]|nr:hypothetical protein BIU82_14655 [Arthrobacter sp. SW1]
MPDMVAPSKPAPGATFIPAEDWSTLNRGDAVWVHEDGWGYDNGVVDEVSGDHRMLWIILEQGGRRLICGNDPLEVWAV